MTIPANGVNPVLFMEEQEPERTKDTRRIKKKKKSEKMEGTQYILNRGQITCTVLTKTQKIFLLRLSRSL